VKEMEDMNAAAETNQGCFKRSKATESHGSRNSTIDIFKALACIGVVWIHIQFPGSVGSAVRALGRFGVPLFFAVSGYYLSSTEVLSLEKISKKLIHIVHLIIGSEIGYIVFTWFLQDLFDPVKRAAYMEKYFVTGWVEKMLITNAPPAYAHLWFLYALATIYLLILLFVRRKRTLRIIGIATPFLILGMVFLQEFSFLKVMKNSISFVGASATTYWAHTILFRAIPFFLLGFLFREFSEKVQRIPGNPPVYIGLIVLCEISAMIESFCFNFSQFYVGNILATILILILCCKFPKLQCKPLEYIGGKLFTWIYIVHVGVYKLLGYCTGRLHIASQPIVKWMMPIMGLLVSILMAMLIEKVRVSLKNATSTYREKRG